MELSYVQFELRAFRNQYDGSVYYGVVNNVADEQSKLGTKYTVPQIAFYMGIVSFSSHYDFFYVKRLNILYGIVYSIWYSVGLYGILNVL